SVQMNGLVNMLNLVPQGDHILAFTFAIPNQPGVWTPAVRNAFMNLGSNMFATLLDTVPFIFYVKKGFISTMHEVSGTNAYDTIGLTGTIECLPASVNENQIEASFIISPNPATTELKIKSEKLKIQDLEIYDVFGNKVLSTPVPSFS